MLHVKTLDTSPLCEIFWYRGCLELGLGQGGDLVMVWERDAADGSDSKDVVLRRRDPSSGSW